MCGVSTIVSARYGEAAPAIARMVAVQHHRGPDGDGTFVGRLNSGAAIAMGHNRLSIIDLSDHAAQPMRSPDGRYVLIFNGEIYNYKEIAAELGATAGLEPGCGDTAVVLAALATWGPAAFGRFNGMWAILLFDTVEHTLLVSRDRFGVKPLYYLRERDRWLFASEIKGILAATPARFAVNPRTVVPYLTRGLINCSDETFFAGIRQFPPASYQRIDLGQLDGAWAEPERFWRHPIELGLAPVPGMVTPEEIRELFRDAVRLRLRSDVPVGVLLSGGVDSSSIVGAIAADGALDNLTVLSVTSNDPAANEEPFIDLMARHVHLTPQKVDVSQDPATLFTRVGEAVWFNDEPLLGASDLAALRLMELARSRGIKVLLSGQGADEQLGGYNKFFYFWIMDLLRRGRVVEAARTVAQFATHSNTLSEFKLSEAMRYMGRGRLAADTFIPEKFQQVDTIDIGAHGSYPRREWIDLVKTSVPALLHYEDRMSMSQSVEVRVPFLDYRLVERLARVHPSEKFAGGWTKSIFRKAITGLVPPEIQYRRDKKGFNVPEDVWMRGAFKAGVLDAFGPGMLAHRSGLVDGDRLRTLYQKYLAGDGILNGRHFFRAYAFEAFLARFADSLS